MQFYLYAQNDEFNFHFIRGKEFASEKKWVFALGEYYDAMLAEPNENGKEAYLAWCEIVDNIKDGNPGIGIFDDFDYIDNWIKILEEYELYWTEHYPYIFIFEKPILNSLNRENKTASYTFPISSIRSSKFNEITAIIVSGFKKAYKDYWNLDYLTDWPEVSVYNEKKYDNLYLVNGTALTSFQDTGHFYASEDILKSKTASDVYHMETRKSKKIPSFICQIPSWNYVGIRYEKYIGFYDYYSGENFSLYRFKYHISDKQGNTLIKCSETTISDISADIMKQIESDEIECILDEITLKYGYLKKPVMDGNVSEIEKLDSIKVKNFLSRTWLDEQNEESVISIIK